MRHKSITLSCLLLCVLGSTMIEARPSKRDSGGPVAGGQGKTLKRHGDEHHENEAGHESREADTEEVRKRNDNAEVRRGLGGKQARFAFWDTSAKEAGKRNKDAGVKRGEKERFAYWDVGTKEVRKRNGNVGGKQGRFAYWDTSARESGKRNKDGGVKRGGKEERFAHWDAGAKEETKRKNNIGVNRGLTEKQGRFAYWDVGTKKEVGKRNGDASVNSGLTGKLISKKQAHSKTYKRNLVESSMNGRNELQRAAAENANRKQERFVYWGNTYDNGGYTNDNTWSNSYGSDNDDNYEEYYDDPYEEDTYYGYYEYTPQYTDGSYGSVYTG